MNLVVAGLSVKLGSRTVLEKIDLSLSPCQIVGLIGPNGAGKSTFLRALNGHYLDYGGAMTIGGSELRALGVVERARRVTYVGADLETDFPLTARELVELGAYSRGGARALISAESVMGETDCWIHRDRFLAELSSGERQRVHLARALYQGSRWICLDESFSRLDLHHQARIGKLLRRYVERGYSFVFVSHDLNFTTDWADRCVLFREGRLIAEGPTAETVNVPNLRRLYPDAEIVLTPHPVSGAMKVYFKG